MTSRPILASGISIAILAACATGPHSLSVKSQHAIQPTAFASAGPNVRPSGPPPVADVPPIKALEQRIADVDPKLNYEDQPPAETLTAPGLVTVIFHDRYKVRAAQGKPEVTASNNECALQVGSLLRMRHAKKVKTLFPDATDEAELDRAEEVLTRRLGKDVPHMRSMQSIEFDYSADTRAIAKELRALPFVRNAYPTPLTTNTAGSWLAYQGRSQKLNPGTPPTDPGFSGTNGSLDASAAVQRDNWWHFNRHRIFRSWDIFNSGSYAAPVVAVIDDGFYNGSDPASDKPVYLTAQAQGFDLSGSPTGSNVDPVGSGTSHGTACASMIASPKNNGYGLSGVAPMANIVPIRTPNTISASSLASVLNWVSNNTTATVVSISKCATVGSNDVPLTVDTTFRAAINYAVYYKNKVVVITAGNTATNINGYSCPKTGEILVGGTQKDGYEWNNSGYGNSVDVAAGAQWVTIMNHVPGAAVPFQLALDNGTSFAAPMVAGVAAMARSIYPSLTPDMIRNAVIGGADYGAAFDQNRYLGWNLSLMATNYGQKAHIRELNAYSTLFLAKESFNRNIVVRVMNTDDYTYATKNWQWSDPPQFSWDGFLDDNFFDPATNVTYSAGDQITFYNYNTGGYRSSGAQLYRYGALQNEYIRGVAYHEAPWATPMNVEPSLQPPLYGTTPVTNDTSTGWLDPTSFLIQ